MDIVIPKQKKRPVKHYLLAVALVVPAVFLGRYLWYLGEAEFSVERDSLIFDEVRRGNFTVSVRGTGVLVPDNVRWLSTAVDARVDEVIVKAGIAVKEGDLIATLSNPELVQEFTEASWELEAQEAEAEAVQVAQEVALLDQRAQVLNARLNYESSALKFEAERKLNEQASGALSKIVFEQTTLETAQFKDRWEIAEEQLKQMEKNVIAQNNAVEARLNKSRKNVERLQKLVDDLEVRATMNSIVLEMPLEPGQRITMGTLIAKLVEEDSLIAELRVPELRIRDVSIGQRAIIDTRNNKINGTVIRIDPAVIDGNVQVDVTFPDGLPDDARPDLSVDGEIMITEIDNTLYVDRPLFVQSRGVAPVYRVSADGRLAERIVVEVGHGSVNEVQILGGLDVGDRIIVSDSSRFETYEKFRIN